MKKLSLALLACGVLTGALAGAEPEFVVGSTIHYAWDECAVEESLSVQHQGGHNSFRTEANWPRCPKQPDGSYRIFPNVEDAFNRMGKYGIAPVVLLCGTTKEIGGNFPYGPYIPPYQDFCEKIAQRYQAKMPLIQIWNEWDGGHMMNVGRGRVNTPENYIEMLKKVYPVVKKAAPNSVVMSNSFCTGDKFIFRCFELGMQDYCDAYSIHTYDLNARPEKVYARLLNVEKTSAKYHNGKPLPFYVTEMSWYTSPGTVSEATQGDYIARFYLLCKAIRSCRGIYWYNFQDRGFNSDEATLFWGMMMRDMTPKDAFYCLESVSGVVRKGTFVKRIYVKDPNVWLMLYKMPDNTYTLAAWTIKPEVRQQIVLNKNGRKDAGELVFERCGAKPLRRHWGFRDQAIAANPKFRINKKENPEQFSFHTTTRPVLVSGLPADFKVESYRACYTPQPKEYRAVMPGAVAEVRRTPSTISIDSDEMYRIITGYPQRGGSKDLSCDLVTKYDDSNLYLTFNVTDNQLVTYEKNGAYWCGDSIQLEFNTVNSNSVYERNRNGYLFAQSSKGVVVLRRYYGGAYGKDTKVSCRFTDHKNGKHTYAVTIPLSELGANLKKLESGAIPLCMSLVLNDNDGLRDDTSRGRKGYLRWGDGVGGDDKNVAYFGWLLFRKK